MLEIECLLVMWTRKCFGPSRSRASEPFVDCRRMNRWFQNGRTEEVVPEGATNTAARVRVEAERVGRSFHRCDDELEGVEHRYSQRPDRACGCGSMAGYSKHHSQCSDCGPFGPLERHGLPARTQLLCQKFPDYKKGNLSKFCCTRLAPTCLVPILPLEDPGRGV